VISGDDTVRLEHGSGGALSRELVENLIYPKLRGAAYPELLDATAVEVGGQAVLTTDSYVVDPPFFPGGDIGRLAVFGTCNDLAVSGARPLWLTLALILEEGYPLRELARVLESLAAGALEAEVAVVTGDTKVVPRGKGGGVYLNTTGIGRRVFPLPLAPRRIQAGDSVIVGGPVGAHGIAVLAARERLRVARTVVSDCALLWPLCRDLMELGAGLRFMRDATRGGIAAVLNEAVAGTNVGIELREADVPVSGGVRTVAEILGLDPLEIANEGVLVAVVSRDAAGEALRLLRAHPSGEQAAVAGTVGPDRAGTVVLQTRAGGRRILDLPRGLLLPRIC